MALMFLSVDDPAEAWRKALLAEIPELDFRIWPEVGDPAAIDLALVWQPPPGEAHALQPRSAASSSVKRPWEKRAPID